MIERIKKHYKEGLLSEARIRKLVELGKITKKQFDDITGKKFVSKLS